MPQAGERDTLVGMAEKTRKRRRARKATPESLEKAAVHYLDRFATSRRNLRRVLLGKVERSARFHGTDRKEGAAAVDGILDRFTAAGLLDDRSYAEARVRTLHGQGASARAIRLKLMQKGVDAEHIDGALARLAHDLPDPEWAAALRFAERKRLGPHRVEAARLAAREKDLAALSRAGFDYDLTKRIVDAESVEELIDKIG